MITTVSNIGMKPATDTEL
ncbi:unnamed protein product [Larinioides sclopetarius]|uniref:Uncharacterized protein n=1 Tax=Larinioides sclopetarius TaxID=280406 RepID=A0AAV2AXX6_9ARAC